MPPIYNSRQFWVLAASLLFFVGRFYFPAFPLDDAAILAAILFALGLVGVVPTVRAQGVTTFQSAAIYNSLAFWQLVAGLVFFVLRYLAPAFPFDESTILAVIVFVLGLFGITPELRQRGLWR